MPKDNINLSKDRTTTHDVANYPLNRQNKRFIGHKKLYIPQYQPKLKKNFLEILLKLNQKQAAEEQQSAKWPQDSAQVIDDFYNLSQKRKDEIANLYQDHNYQALWFTKEGRFNKNAQNIQQILNQEIYLTTPINSHYITNIDLSTHTLNQDNINYILKYDLALTIRMISAFDIIYNGLINHNFDIQNMGINEKRGYKHFDIHKIFSHFIQGNVAEAINILTQFQPQYNLLKQQMVNLHLMYEEDILVDVPVGKKMKYGRNVTNPAIKAIRKRLYQLGFAETLSESNKFDKQLKQQVIAFQKSRGLKADGIISEKFYLAMQETMQFLFKKLLVNIERLRHAPLLPNIHKKHLRVNIPEMQLHLYEGSKPNLSMRVIVGREDRATPVFNDLIQYIDFNPYWYVPYSLVTKDILPKLKRNALYGQRKGIYFYQNGKKINPTSVNWHKYSEKNFPFTARQDPGKRNALGTVKFIFPNKHAVYLHDTPGKRSFLSLQRFLSSGCIRVQEPKKLAISLLNKQVSASKIYQIFKSRKNKKIYLKSKIPVNIEYQTAFVHNNILNIRPDIYQYDPILLDALLDAADNHSNKKFSSVF